MEIKNEKKVEDKPRKAYNPSKSDRKILKWLQDRINVLELKKKDLGIDRKCDRMDRLFTPHFTSLNGGQDVVDDGYYTDFDMPDKSLVEMASRQKRKSKPLAFEKITTAIASLIKEVPKPRAKAFSGKYSNLNKLVEKTYIENWESNRLIKPLKRFTYHLAKYGIAYGFRRIKREWKISHIADGQDDKGNVKYKEEKITKCNEVIWETINPRYILLDDCAIEPSDANDGAVIFYHDNDSFKSVYPEQEYPNAKYAKAGFKRLISIEGGTHKIKTNKMTGDHKDKIQVLIYQNENKDMQYITANGVLIDSMPLPGSKLGIFGAKWVEDGEDIDGIGVGEILEIYQPIVDDILNSSNERLRQLVKPVRVLANDVKISNDEDFIWQSGSEMRVDGDISQIKWDRPPVTSSAEITEREMIDQEIDVATFIPKALAGVDVSDTAYQAAQNREAALKKLTLPLDNIKDALEDDANIAFRLFKVLYSQPEEVYYILPETQEFEEAIIALSENPEDERFVWMPPEKEGGQPIIARRKFKEVELGLSKEIKKEEGRLVDTGNVIESEEATFWEMIPNHFNWEGYINIEPMSFIPVSESLVIQEKKERTQFLMSIPDTDEMGNPTLKDENGVPFKINRVQAIKDYVDATREDPDKYVIPMNENPQGNANGSPLEDGSEITPKQQVGMERPETQAQNGAVDSIKGNIPQL